MNIIEKIGIDIKLSFDVDDEKHNKFQIGPGVIALCMLIDDFGSLSSASKEMKMAYSKAWRIIRHAENALGFDLIERKGKAGSSLTFEGKRLVYAYVELRKNINEFANQKFEEIALKI